MRRYPRCPRCSRPMKRIPIRRFDSVFVIELYCERCGEVVTVYPHNGEIKFEHEIFSNSHSSHSIS